MVFMCLCGWWNSKDSSIIIYLMLTSVPFSGVKSIQQKQQQKVVSNNKDTKNKVVTRRATVVKKRR